MRFLTITIALLLTSCARQSFIKPGTFTIINDNAVIEKCANCDIHAFFIHFPKEVSAADFDAALPGVESITQNDKYSIIVRVGVAFNQVKVLRSVAKSGKQ